MKFRKNILAIAALLVAGVSCASAQSLTPGGGSGGGGSLTVTDGTHSVPSTTTATFGNGFVVGGSSGSATVNMAVANATKTASYSAAAADMGNALNLAATTGTPALTLPAVSSTIFSPGMTLTISTAASTVNWTVTNSTGLTLSGLNSTTLPPGTSGTFVANADGTTLNFFPGPQPPTTTVVGSVMAKDCTAGGQFVQTLNTNGTVTCATPAGGGNVSAAGTLTSGQIVIGQGSQSVAVGNISGDCTTSGSTAITCTKTSGTSFGALATVTPGTGVATAAAANLSAAGGLTTTIASGTAALGTSAISSAACATVVTVAATNVATTDVVLASFNGDPTAVTGYIPATSGMLTIIGYPTSGNVNFKVCNNTAGSITPGAITLNWRVAR